MRGWLKLTLSLVVLSWWCLAPEAWAGAPTEAVKGVVDEVLGILNDSNLKGEAKKVQRRQRIKQAINRRFDYEEMSARSLGPHWRSLSAGQRREFVQVFSQLLEASYAERFDAYTGEKVTYTQESQDGDQAEVRTLLLLKNDRIPMNYRLLLKPQGWVVYDVVIEGVSMVSNYRSQFTRVIRESSYAGLLGRLRAKVGESRTSS